MAWWAAICAVLLALPMPSIGQQPPSPSSAVVRVTGKVDRPLVLHDSDLRELPRKSVTVTDERGAKVTYEGVPVTEILRRAGAPLGKQLKGPQMTLYVLVNAIDGYRAVFALPEFDPGFTDQVILLADRRDGHPMTAPDGPFRIVVPDEKRHARWVREVTSLEVRQAQ